MSAYEVVSRNDKVYPVTVSSILGGRDLFTIGQQELMGRPAIGICGSRNASKSALEWAYKFGEEAARHDAVVVSGYAKGVDRQAHKGALAAGGTTIAVLPEGIEHFRLIRELEPLVDLRRNFLAVSMFEPRTPWKAYHAMERNKLIVALSAGLFVIEARERGGTIDAARECLRQNKRLCVVDYNKVLPGREGNRLLLAGSAIPLKHTGDLRAALKLVMSEHREEAQQLVLDLATTRD